MASFIKNKRKMLKGDNDIIYIDGFYPTEFDGNREYHINRKKTFFSNDSMEILKERGGHYTETIIGIQKQQWRTAKHKDEI